MADAIEGMTDIDLHDETAALLGIRTFEQEVDHRMRFHPTIYGNRLNCERTYRRWLAENRERREIMLRHLRAEDAAGHGIPLSAEDCHKLAREP